MRTPDLTKIQSRKTSCPSSHTLWWAAMLWGCFCLVVFLAGVELFVATANQPGHASVQGKNDRVNQLLGHHNTLIVAPNSTIVLPPSIAPTLGGFSRVVKYEGGTTSTPRLFMRIRPQPSSFPELARLAKMLRADVPQPLTYDNQFCYDKETPDATKNLIKWKARLNFDARTTIDNARLIVQREAAAHVLPTNKVTVIVRTDGGNDYELWRKKCLHVLRSCSSVDQIHFAKWNRSKSLANLEGESVVLYDQVKWEGLGYRIVQNCTSGICLLLDDDRCIQKCSALGVAIALLKEHPTKIVAGVTRSWRMTENANCPRFPRYKRGGWQIGLVMNSIFSAFWPGFIRDVLPPALMDYASKIKNCEDIFAIWLQTLMQEDHRHTVPEYRLLAESLPEISLLNLTVGVTNRAHPISGTPAHQRKRDGCTRLMFQMYSKYWFYPLEYPKRRNKK